LINSDGSNERQLIIKSGGDYELTHYDNYEPAISPDGQKIAFTVASEWSGHPPVIYMMNSDGTNIHRFIGRFYHEGGISAHYERPSWSPDGKRLAIINCTSYSQVYVVNVDGTDRELMAGGEWASWSSDGSRITFSTGKDIYIIHSDGSMARRIAKCEGYDPSWKPCQGVAPSPALTTATKADLVEALKGLREAMLEKIDSDIDNTAIAFTDVKNYKPRRFHRSLYEFNSPTGFTFL